MSVFYGSTSKGQVAKEQFPPAKICLTLGPSLCSVITIKKFKFIQSQMNADDVLLVQQRWVYFLEAAQEVEQLDDSSFRVPAAPGLHSQTSTSFVTLSAPGCAV